jgi:uncharacterized membrane protein
MVTAQADVPEGERLAKVEANVETLIRDMSEVRADIRDLRSDMRDLRADMGSGMNDLRTVVAQNAKDLRAVADRNFMWTLGIIIPMWVTIIVAIVVAILVRS